MKRIFIMMTALLLSMYVAAQDETTTMIETPHIKASKGAFAETVLMPGDPLRAKYIAETFLEDAQLITSVRNMLGYTGTYKGVRISVMASGMGIPSAGIYSWELYNVFGVENIIRIGSAGSYKDWLNVLDVALAESSVSESTYARTQNGETANRLYPSSKLNNAITQKAQELGIPLKTCTVRTSDAFYTDPSQGTWKDIAERTGTDCVEMESFAIFHNAKALGKNAACLLTISDSFVTKQELTSEERQTSFSTMMRLALETAVTLNTTSLPAPSTATTGRTDGKYVENGRIVIINGDRKYTPEGVRR